MPENDDARAADSPRVLRAADRAPQPWRNGGGVTFEVARRAASPQSALEFLWRVSIARVESAGPFSSFAGYERLIAVIEGSGMLLSGIAPQNVALRPFVPFRFDGAASVTGALPAGPVSDLNVIFDPRHCTAGLSIVAELAERRASCTELLILNLGPSPMECTIDVASLVLAHRDAVWITSPDAAVSCRDIERAAVIEIDHGVTR
jgi:environmental stress-induced protein Ves